MRAWIEALLETPGTTGVTQSDDAWRVHLDGALAAIPLVEEGPVVDVGSGGGSPGLPIAAARPDLRVELLDAKRRRCDFLRTVSRDFSNVGVVCKRAEEHGRGEGRDAYAVAVARALAPPPVAAEWCLPLVRPGGRLVLLAGAADEGDLAVVADALAAAPPEVVCERGAADRRLLVFRKLGPTPARFPRRAGLARKRPLG